MAKKFICCFGILLLINIFTKAQSDIIPPSVVSVTPVSSTKIDVLFSEPVDHSAGIFSNYYADGGLGMPVSAIADSQNVSLVHLSFENAFTNGYAYTLSISNVKDYEGNTLIMATAAFSFFIPQRNDIVIDELMADPLPVIGLPEYEWIELKNNSSFPINLEGWTISDLTGMSGPLHQFILEPDSFLIVCSTTAKTSMSSFGKVKSVSRFPSLGNERDLIFISDAQGKVIHAVQYTNDWYQNELKKNGGWSLEMIDPKNPCGGSSNWISSKDKNGGTPGKKNSADAVNKDELAPKVIKAFAKDPMTVTLVFNKPLDSMEASSVKDYVFDNGLVPIKAVVIPPLFDQVNIFLNNPVEHGITYHLSAVNVFDCSGNVIQQNNFTRFGLATSADTFDLVINEILFNPLPSGVDYVELYNRSKKIIDLSKVYIANRNTSNEISSITQLQSENFLLFPEDFIAVTTDPVTVKSQYISLNPEAFLKIKNLPSFSDDKGNVIILNESGIIIDAVNYSDKWHFPLLHNTEGVSLERIDYNTASVQKNFHSAATSAGYGTPGYRNSQYKSNEEVNGEIIVTPEIFSPDNDGQDDFATIHYTFPSPGYVCNVTIFDASGRPVRFLEKNSLNGIKGFYRWDGLDDKNRKLPQGIYVIFTEVFNKDGKKNQFKNTIVLARRNF
ncbi:MAG: lamin tail domain-containing protein [Ginsengibacter sp.]